MTSGRRPKDIKGQTFSLLTAIEISGRDKHKNVIWECQCECGSVIHTTASSLLTGHTKSCGCLKIELLKKRVTKHGKSQTNIYDVWLKMISRCHNKSDKSFKFYGERGIFVCNEWRESFDAFISDMGVPEKGMSLERVKNNDGYNKENCRWRSRLDQANNMRSNLMVSFDKECMTLAQFARMLGFKYGKVRSAIRRGIKHIGGYDITVSRRN